MSAGYGSGFRHIESSGYYVLTIPDKPAASGTPGQHSSPVLPVVLGGEQEHCRFVSFSEAVLIGRAPLPQSGL